MQPRRIPTIALLVLGLAAPAVGTPIFYAIDEDHSILGTFDVATGVWTDIGVVRESARGSRRRVRELESMAYDSDSRRLLAVSSPSGHRRTGLYEINPLTAEATLIGEVGFSEIRGLVYDPVDELLIGASITGGSRTEFLSIDLTTGAGTSLGTLNLGGVYGLAHDPNTGTVYGSLAKSKKLATIDLNAMTFSLFARHGFRKVEAIAFNEPGELYGVDDAGRVLQFDPSDGSAVALTHSGATGDVDGMTFAARVVPAPATLLLCLLGGLLVTRRTIFSVG